MKRFYTLLVILTLFSSWIHSATASDEADWMPDANLRTAVRSALNLNNNDALTQAGMANLTRLTARNAQISSLTGLEHATNLQKLDLRDNTISNISALSGLTNLESLKLKGNNISSVSALSGLTNLTLLNLKENNISNISDLSGLTNLEHLRVDANSITDVQPLTSLVNLERLWIAGNSLTNAHLLSSLTGLTQIDIPIPDPPDTTAPSVTVSVPSGTQNGTFDATITFTESVSNFVQSDVSLSGSAASITSWRANSGNTVYTATITPTASGTVTIGVAANVATDAANNQNTAATSKSVTVSVDTTAPGVTVSVPSGTQNGTFDATITFTETVSGFTQSDVSLSGSAASITGWRANSGNTVYTATITPTASGSVTIGVAANVATDAANNQNIAATSQTVSVDVDKPSVTIGVPSGTQNGAFDATITFTESVSNFVQSDVSLRGSAASITSWRANSSNTIYTATITPTASGSVTIGVAANVATDAANNQNTAATSKSVTVSVDTISPDVTVSVPSGVQNGAFNATITFTEPVSGFVRSEVSLSGSAASITGWRANSGDTAYTATITPTTSGTVTIGVAANVATDAANNANTAATSKTVSIDVDKPTTTIGVPSGTQTGAFDVTITFSETVSGFAQSDVSLSGSAASITGWRANSGNTVYTATITPTASGTVTIGVAANVATDAANNANTAATSKTVTVNIPDPIPDPSTWMPDANLRTAVRSALSLGNNDTLTQAGMANLTRLTARNAQISSLTGLEHATNLTSLDLRDNTISNISALSGLMNLESLRLKGNNISSVSALSGLTNLTLLNLKENNISSISTLSGLTNLEHLRVDANSITDVQPLTRLVNLERLWIAGNSLINAHLLSSLTGLTYIDIPIPDPPDTIAPRVTVSVPSGTQNGAFNVTITFTESVSNFVQSDVSLSGSAASITSWRANSGNTVYTATITPTSSGSITFDVNAGVATDAANNQNTAATSQTVIVDVDAPGVSVSVLSDKQTGVFDATIMFTEAVSGFEQADLSLTGTANASITAWSTTDNTTYIATITPTTEGTVIINVPANVATDAAGNNNSAGTAQIVTVKFKDTEAPTVTINVPADVQNGAFAVSFIFSEAVSVFEDDEVSLTGTASATITAWDTTDKITYTATITPTASGEVIINVPAGIAADANRNPNTAAVPQTVHVDIDSPTVSITAPSSEQSGEFNVTITFSEAVSGFTQSDVSLTGSAASITAWSANSDNTVYTATITPTTSGMVTLNIAADVATNAANNQNTAATSQTIAINIPDPDAAVLIPDANLAAAIRKTLGLADDATITVADMRQLIELDAQESDISELTGLEHATNLEKLRLFENSISDISPLSKLTNLTFLNIFDNSISDISPLSKLTNLRGLYLNNNNMSDISISDISPLSELTNLTGLSLAGNNISDISPLSELTNLRGLDLQSIGISDLSSLSGLTNLTYLVIGGNNTGDISWLSELTSLTGLSLALDNRSDISPLSELTSLTGLSLAGNNISDISPLSELTNLEMLYLDNNSISDISPLSELTNLEELYLNNNSISDVSPLSGLTSLRYLTLWYYLILDTSPLYPLLKANGGSLEYVNIKVSQYPPWDVNEDGSVNAADSALVTAALGQSGTAIVNPRTDVNGDGTVDADDLTLVTDNLDTDNSAPSSMGLFTLLDRETLETLDPTILEAQLEILRTQSDGSLKYLRAIALLESILAALRPDETRLLSNYPNPFNPETWIPYHLANDTDVQISIYDINGALVRQLDLGYQRAGYYTDRSRAAYWDGRNEFGERVATGIYFYQLQAGSESFLRKMVILK